MFVVLGPILRCQRGEGVQPLLPFEVRSGTLVAREDRRGGAELGSHVGDGGALRHVEMRHAGAVILEHAVHAALDGQPPQHLENHVLGRHPRLQAAVQLHPQHLWHAHAIGASRHGQGDVKPAGTDGQHAHAAARRGVAVGAQQRGARHRVAFEVHLMADTVAGP